MNVDAIRHLYGYHFAENRATWDKYIVPLSQAHFTQESPYSMGSIRNQIVHMISVDNTWFSGLRGVEIPPWFDPTQFDDRDVIRATWDTVEKTMQDYLANLTDEILLSRPLEDEDKDLVVWQVLMQVINHGTDHRAQILRLLYDLGVKTVSQDYIFYAYDAPIP